VDAKVRGADGNFVSEIFLVDSCADCTVFSALLLTTLNLPSTSPSPGVSLKGISGGSSFVFTSTTVEFTRDDGAPAHVHGQFAGFTAPTATDLSILGRDVLDHFDVILSRRRDEVLLLAGRYLYQVTAT
jgi:hypothetical protein